MREIYLFASIALTGVLIFGYVILTNPHIDYSYERTGSEPVSITVEYLNATGDPLCTKLYLKSDDSDKYRAVIPRLPSDLQDPHDNEDLQFGKSIELVGYRYKAIEWNKITGKVAEKNLDRFDVIAWEAAGIGKQSTRLTDLKPNDFQGENYTACLWD